MRGYFDFETRSAIDLPSQGEYVYAEDPSADILLLAYELPGYEAPRFWTTKLPVPADLVAFVKDTANEMAAHRAEFDVTIWNKIGVKYGLPPLDLNRIICTRAKCKAYNIPAGLEAAAEYLNLAVKKGKRGKTLINELCKPNKDGGFNRDPALFLEMVFYGGGDVVVLKAIDQAVPDLSPFERRVWVETTRMNMEGLEVDLKSIAAIKQKIEHARIQLAARVSELTGGVIGNFTQGKAIVAWVNEQGYPLASLEAHEVDRALRDSACTGSVRAVLDIRKAACGSAIAKLDTMERMACLDGRVRGNYDYHGAGPGRWTSRGVQTQNLPTPSIKDTKAALNRLLTEDMPPEETLFLAKNVVPSMIVSGEGFDFVECDFSSIEMVTAFWLVQDFASLDSFASGRCMYSAMAAVMYGEDYDAIKDGHAAGDKKYYAMRQGGKMAMLLFLYGGAEGAAERSQIKNNAPVDHEENTKNVKLFRDNNPKLVAQWGAYHDAAKKSLDTPNRSVASGKCLFRYDSDKDVLKIRLPSGRVMYFHKPRTDREFTYDKPIGAKAYRAKLYPGKWLQNINQAVARDVAASALVRLADAGYIMALTTHDSLGAKLPKDKSEEEFVNLFRQVEPWMEGMVIKAKFWRDWRYNK